MLFKSVKGLKKDAAYKCEFYTGTYFQDYKLTADARTFHQIEAYTFSDYDFVHSNFIVINLPDYMNSGYYSINGLGLFRYITEEDKAFYNGETYSDLIDWNATIRALIETGYDGVLSLEIGGYQNPDPYLKQSIAYLKAVLQQELIKSNGKMPIDSRFYFQN